MTNITILHHIHLLGFAAIPVYKHSEKEIFLGDLKTAKKVEVTSFLPAAIPHDYNTGVAGSKWKSNVNV